MQALFYVCCDKRAEAVWSDLHVHDVCICLHHAIAHMQSRLEANLGFLNRDHGFFQAYGGVLHLDFSLKR